MTAAILRAGARTFLSVRKHRNYRLFFTGQVISNIGTWMQRVAQAWLVLSLTHSAFAVGILALCQFMPFTLFSLIAGVVVDRLDSWRTVISTQLTQMVLASTIAVIALAGIARPWHVYVIAALMGLVQVLDAPSRQQLTFRMVGPLELPNAISLNSGVFNGARIFGPALGGIIIAAAGAGVCFAVNAASYIAVLAGLLMMRPQEFHAVERRARSRTLYIGLKEGISFARNHEQIRLMLMLTFVISTFCLNFNVLLPVLAKQTLHSGPQVFGLLSAVFGVGALIGALFSAHLSRATVGTTALGSAGFALCELLIAPLRTTVFIALLLFIGGVCFTTWSSNSSSLIQLASPEHLRGRLIGIYFFAFAGTGTLGGIMSGWLTALGGTELSFTIAGVVGLSASLYVWLRSRVVPLVEERPADEALAA
ncbi:MAG TPA: MFS transporter [Gaiellaceae bacterium]|nr:MFS transporter [Gaiellaceae bacterium]